MRREGAKWIVLIIMCMVIALVPFWIIELIELTDKQCMYLSF